MDIEKRSLTVQPDQHISLGLVSPKPCQGRFSALVSIAVQAPIGTRVIHSDVPAGHAAALLARWLERGDPWAIWKERGEQIAIDTARLLHPPPHQRVLTTGMERDGTGGRSGEDAP